MPKKPAAPKTVDDLNHEGAKRPLIPTAEAQAAASDALRAPLRVEFARRNADLDPQLMWRGKLEADAASLFVDAAPLYIQEKIHPKALVDDLRRHSQQRADESSVQPSLFADVRADFNGLPPDADRTAWYAHQQNWTNRMILGDSLRVMASLSEREGLRGQVQCIYIDPPYGIKFNSNFQPFTTSRDVKDGNTAHITREPEQVKAFRDTWRDGIHSYLSYLRDRLLVARDLLHESGSIFVQIGDENVHRVRCLMDEVFGEDNYCGQITFAKTSGQTSSLLSSTFDYLIWFCKNKECVKFRQLFDQRQKFSNPTERYVFCETNDGRMIDLSVAQKEGREPIPEGRIVKLIDTTSQTGSTGSRFIFNFQGHTFSPPGSRGWSSHEVGMHRVGKAGFLHKQGKHIWWKSYRGDYTYRVKNLYWRDTVSNAFGDERIYVVQTNTNAIQHCLLMTTDPGDLVLDPTCGSGTTAYVAEQWGRRWITVDTSRVALALARARLMGARYPWYLLADSREGALKEAEISQTPFTPQAHYGGAVRQGFVYERVPHITLKSIANNAEIDVIWDKWQKTLVPLRETLNAALKKHWEEWEIPRTAGDGWPPAATKAHADWWEARIARQKEIDACIAARADYEYLYDKPYEDKKRVRVAGPFTVESLSPHRMIGVDENGDALDPVAHIADERAAAQSFENIILGELAQAGVQQAHKAGRIHFRAVTPRPGRLVCAEGEYVETVEGKSHQRRAAIFIGPEFGSVQRSDLTAAAEEAAEGGFDMLLACAFAYDAHTSGLTEHAHIPILRARMNAELHMSDDLKGAGNMFVVFGEPDIEKLDEPDGTLRLRLHGVDVYRPSTREVASSQPQEIACWFIDTDYDGVSFFVRHAYFPGASSDPYKSLKTTLRAEIDAEAWESLHSTTSRPFPRPASGRIAVKVINHLGDEVMRVFDV